MGNANCKFIWRPPQELDIQHPRDKKQQQRMGLIKLHLPPAEVSIVVVTIFFIVMYSIK